MLNYMKPVISKVNLLEPEAQKTAVLVIANVIFITILTTITVTCLLLNFI